MTVAHSITSSARASSVGGTVETERFGGLEVDDQLELRRLLDRQVGRLGTFENAIHEIGRASIQTENVHSIANEAARLRVFLGPDRRQPICERKCRDSSKARGKLSVLGNDNRIDSALGHRHKGAVKLAGALCPRSFEVQAQRYGEPIALLE